MAYQALGYEQADHVVTLTYNRRFRDDDAFVLVITGAGETTFCAGWDLQDAAELSELGDYDAFRVSLYNSPGACGYTRKVDIFQTSDRGDQRLCLRRRSRNGAADRHPDRCRERGVGTSSAGMG